MRLIKLLPILFVLNNVYAQTLFDSLENVFLLIPRDNLNLIISAWIIYAIVKYALELRVKDNSGSNIIAGSLSAAGTYLIYSMNIPFIELISPFIVLIVISFLGLMLKRTFSNFSNLSNATNITNGIILVVFALLINGFANSGAILSNYISYISTLLFFTGFIIISISFFNSRKSEKDDDDEDSDDNRKLNSELSSNQNVNLKNQLKDYLADNQFPIKNNTKKINVENNSPSNSQLSQGIYRVHHENIIGDIKNLSSIIENLTEEFEKDHELFIKDIVIFEDIKNIMKRISNQSRICQYLASLAQTDSADFISLLEKINNFDSKWNTISDLNDQDRSLMIQEHKAIIMEYNKHNTNKKIQNHDEIKSKLTKSFVKKYFHSDFIENTTKLILTTIHSNKKTGEQTLELDELLSEKKDLKDILNILSEQIKVHDKLNTELNNKNLNIIKTTEILKNTQDLISSHNNKLLSIQPILDSSSNMINMISTKIKSLDYDLLQGTNNIHNRGYIRNMNKNSNQYGV